MKSVIKALTIARKIIEGEYEKDDWRSILDSIAEIYNVGGSFIGFWEDDIINFKHSSYLLNKNFPKNTFKELYEAPLKSRHQLYGKLISNGHIVIEDYPKYEEAIKPWLDVGLKSLLAVVIKSQRHTYGSLHLISLDKHRTFTKDEIESLKVIADTIGSELDKEEYIRKINFESEKSRRQLELLKILDDKLKQSVSLNLIVESLKKIKNLLNADKLNFLFPSENLYFEINGNSTVGSIKTSKNHPIYNFWKTNTTTIVQKPQTRKNFAYAIFIPIISLNKTVAAFSFEYQEKPSENFMNELDTIRIALTHYVSILHTYKNINTVVSKLSDIERGLIQAFISVTEAKDTYTRGHSEHVAFYSKLIAQKLGLDKEQQEMIYNAGLLHDIGKIGIPDMILLKPGKLTPFEYEIMKHHSLISYEIVKKIPKFKDIAMCIRHHHEKMDGSGYPDGLTGKELELGARILAIADIFDALTTDRPYRDALSPKKAIEILENDKVDQNILKKVKEDLIKSYVRDIPKSKFIPKQIESLRKEIMDLDFMTGLKRRRFLIRTMDKYILRKNPFTLFLIDIKNTSYINFKYGREIGDRIILFVSEELKKILKMDALSRVGADSFMFLYLSEDAEVFKNILQTKLKKGILEKIKDKNCVINPKEAENMMGCYVTFSLYPKEGKTPEELIYICSQKKKMESFKYHVGIPCKKNA